MTKKKRDEKGRREKEKKGRRKRNVYKEEDGKGDIERSRGIGDGYKRKEQCRV